MGETQRLNTGRSSQFADTASGSGTVLAFSEVTYTGGTQSFGAIADVTGVSISLNLAVAGTVQFFGSGASLANPFIQGNYLGLAISVNGTDYYGNGTGAQGFNAVGGGNLVTGGFTGGNAISMHEVLNLAAGSYTINLRAFGNGYLESSATFPTKLTVVYPALAGDIASASPLTKQEVGPFAATVNPPDTTYQLVPSSTITVVLSSSQVVLFSAYTHFIDPGSNSVSGNVGVRLTSPGPVVTDYDGSQARGGNDVNYAGSSITRAVQLGAGSHTFDLIVRNPASGASFEYANAFLTTVYTTPAAVQAAPFTFMQSAVRTAGNFAVNTSGGFADVPGPLEVTINTTGGDALIEVQGSGKTSVSNPAELGLGLKIDGVEQSGIGGPGWSAGGFSVIGAQGCGINQHWGNLSYKFLATGLSSGSHTFRLTASSAGFGGGLGDVAATTSKPLRIIVWYN